MKIEVNGILIDVVITRKKIKNIYFRVKEDLKLYVSCHPICSNQYIENLLYDNKSDILRMYNKMKEKYEDNTKIYYLGNEMNFVYSNKIKIDEDTIYGPSIETINDYLEKNSLNLFQERLDRIRILFNNLPNFRLRTRKMKTRWGVCNKSSMTVTLNTTLIHKDVTLIDYVIIHELCHFKHMDHSPSFWKEVEKYYPYYKLARERLK